MERLPSVHAVRPSFCPECRAICGQPSTGFTVEGHGQRPRDVVVVVNEGGLRFKRIRCWSRRFLCNACGHCWTVLPEGVVPGCLYSLSAIVVAWFASSRVFGDEPPSAATPVCAPEGADRTAQLRWRTPDRWGRRLAQLLPNLITQRRGWRLDVDQALVALVVRGRTLDPEGVASACVDAYGLAHGGRGMVC